MQVTIISIVIGAFGTVNKGLLKELECYILTFDPAQKYYSKVIHRKEVTHSNGQ